MKTLILISFALARLTFGQTTITPEFTHMTPDEFRAQAKIVNTGAQRWALAEAAFSSKDMELIVTCHNATGMIVDFTREFVKLPPGDFKSRIMMNVLKEEWYYDEPLNGMPTPFQFPPNFTLEEECLAIFATMVPEAGLKVGDIESARKLRNRESRTKLSRMLEDKLNLAEKQKANNEDSMQAPNDASESSPSPTAPLPRTTKRVREVTTTTQPNEKPISSTPWSIIVGVAMAALGVMWLFLKGRK